MGLTHSSDGLGQGQEPPGIWGEEAAPPEDAWGKAYNLLEGDRRAYCQLPSLKFMILKISFSPNEYTGTREALQGEIGYLHDGPPEGCNFMADKFLLKKRFCKKVPDAGIPRSPTWLLPSSVEKTCP